MTILQLTNAYGPRTGGIRTHIDSLRPRYAARGVTAALVIPGSEDRRWNDDCGPVIQLAAPPLPINPDYRNLWAAGPVLQAVRELRPDAVEILDKWTLPRLARPLAERCRVVGFSCERLDQVLTPYLGRRAVVRAGIRAYNRWFARQFETVVCHSLYAADELRQSGAGNVRIVPLGVDLATFHPAARDEAWRSELLGDGEVLLAYVGRLVKEKDVRLLAAMMAQLDARYRLVIAGSGPEEAALRGVPGIRLLGFERDRARLAALCAGCDVFVFPSGIETFALSVLEALACGARVVAVAGGAVPEVLPEGAGLLSPPTGAGLAAAVEAACHLPATAARLARRTAERYDWERTADDLLALHQEGTLG